MAKNTENIKLNDIRQIEEISMNALPSLQTLVYDGWIIRFAGGYTKRANSINPLYNSNENINQKINTCEDLFAMKSMPPVFKMTPAVYPANLEQILEANGYRDIDYTSVQTLDLTRLPRLNIKNIVVSNSLEDQWLINSCRLNAVAENDKLTLRKMLANILPLKFFVSISCENAVIASGMGVMENDFIGLFSLVVDKDYRNQGFGAQLVSQLLHLGKTAGAKKAYLQVRVNNFPALKLYAKLGFAEIYQYWYRIKQTPP